MKLPLKTWIKKLTTDRTKAKINPALDKALEAIIQALSEKDLNLACQLTAVKSQISGILDPKSGYAFQEDCIANMKILGNSLYSTLDHIHHEISFALDEIPSGMMVIGPGILKEFRAKKIDHPVLKLIRLEQHRKNRSPL